MIRYFSARKQFGVPGTDNGNKFVILYTFEILTDYVYKVNANLRKRKKIIRSVFDVLLVLEKNVYPYTKTKRRGGTIEYLLCGPGVPRMAKSRRQRLTFDCYVF